MSFIMVKLIVNLYGKPVAKNLGDKKRIASFSLLLLGRIGGTLKSGPNEGLYEEEAIYLLLYIFASVGTILLGIVAGIIVKIFADE